MLEWSTVAEMPGKAKSHLKKPCLFCGHEYAGGPHHIRIHIDMKRKPRDVAASASVSWNAWCERTPTSFSFSINT